MVSTNLYKQSNKTKAPAVSLQRLVKFWTFCLPDICDCNLKDHGLKGSGDLCQESFVK